MTGYEDFIFKLVTVYGPLGLGWPFWYLERRYNRELTKALIDLYAAATAGAASMKQLLEERLPKR